jgi:hypothetical protein
MNYVDITKWVKKSEACKRSIAVAKERLIKMLAQEVMTETAKNLKGPRYGKAVGYRGPQTGKMPIPRITADLVGSMRLQQVLDGGGFVIYSDPAQAPYAKYVHDGYATGFAGVSGKWVQGRPFLKNAVDTVKRTKLEEGKAEFAAIIGAVGQL